MNTIAFKLIIERGVGGAYLDHSVLRAYFLCCIGVHRDSACKMSRSRATSKAMVRTSVFIFCLFVVVATELGWAQNELEKGTNEVQVWAGGGHSVPGGTSLTEAFDAGLRYGRVLTGPHWPWILRGRFEYAADIVPVYLIFQPANTAYGWGFNPLVLKWNFERHRRFSPYFELSGGAVFSNHSIPTYTNTVNFT